MAGEVTGPEPDVVARLGWGVRHYLALIVVAIVAAIALLLTAPASERRRTYEAQALVVATALEIETLQLPRTMDAVFTAGSVAESVASQIPGTGPPHRLVPEAIRLEPLNDTIAARVIGRSRDPARAADLANAAAFYLVAEMNRLGEGVGGFAVQTPARPPVPESESSLAIGPVALGVLIGGALGLGVVALLLLGRRPVISGVEAADIVGAPLVVSLELPARRRGAQLQSVRGLSLLTRRLFPGRARVCALVGTGPDAGARLDVMALVAGLLSRTQPVRLVVVPSEERALAARTRSAPNVTVVGDATRGLDGRGLPTDADEETAVLFGLSATDVDVPQLLPVWCRVVLLVAEGARRDRVESSARQFAVGEVEGVAFVKRVGWLRRRIPSSEGPGTGTGTDQVRGRSDVRQEEQRKSEAASQ